MPAAAPLEVDVQLLTIEQAKAVIPDRFEENDDGESFNELPATGNADWLDYWPDYVLLVRTKDGTVVSATCANAWHMTECGFTVPPVDA